MFLLDFLTFHNQSNPFLLRHHKNVAYMFCQKNLQHFRVLSVHPYLSPILKLHHHFLRWPALAQHLLAHHYVVAHSHIQVRKLLLNDLWLIVLFYLQFHNRHNIFFQDILLHIYWSLHRPWLA